MNKLENITINYKRYPPGRYLMFCYECNEDTIFKASDPEDPNTLDNCTVCGTEETAPRLTDE